MQVAHDKSNYPFSKWHLFRVSQTMLLSQIALLEVLVASVCNAVFQCFYNVFLFLKFYHKYFKCHAICANKDIIR